MGRRRSVSKAPPEPFAYAMNMLAALEQNVVNRTIDVTFEPLDVITWLYDPFVVQQLRAAYPFVHSFDRGHTIVETVYLPVASNPLAAVQAAAIEATLTVATSAVQMPVPDSGLANLQDSPTADKIRATLRDVYAVHCTFEKVRAVIRWLNEYTTIGAARHYCPWLAGLLPAGHAFHEYDGRVYREPAASMSLVAPLMRESGAIVASALLAGEPPAPKTTVTCQFRLIRDTTEMYHTQTFGLL